MESVSTTTCLKQSKDVEFQDVYYTVTQRANFVKVTGTRKILRGVSGSFRNGQLSAILGPSGAGKSSLLNALSGFRTSGVDGHIIVSRKDSCYITQEDNHQTLLTVEELMNLSCNLKLRSIPKKHELIIMEILENLNLNHRRNVYANKLSGGERKRLSIALELVANPNIFFLDEPTSGLDEVTAANCIRLLSNLAKQGRTIVCTIHQPSATIFNYFHNIFVLARGQCVYQGSPSALIPFLKHVQLDCPKYYSPSDYIIELCDANDGNFIGMLSKVTNNGKLVYAPQSSNELMDENTFANHSGSDDIVQYAHHSKDFRLATTTVFLEHPKRSVTSSLRSAAATPTYVTLFGWALILYERMKALTKRIYWERQDISGFQQFYILLKMMLLKIMRARLALMIQLFHHTLCGLFFGLIFFKLGNQGNRMFDHLKFCIGTVLVIVYTQMMVPILSYPGDVKVVKKETFNRWYSLPPYYMALTMSRLPLQIILNMIFLSLIYWMTGLPCQMWRFGLFSAVGLMTSFVAEGMGLAIGATFSITNGSVVGPMVIAPFLGLAIYGFDFASQIPFAVNLLMKFSYIRVSVVALVLSVFGFNREELECKQIYCHFGDPRVLLRFIDIEKASMLQQFGLLTLLLLFFRTLLYISLRKRCGT